jgi:hypothetical protein
MKRKGNPRDFVSPQRHRGHREEREREGSPQRLWKLPGIVSQIDRRLAACFG